jgi:hypothetical protein
MGYKKARTLYAKSPYPSHLPPTGDYRGFHFDPGRAVAYISAPI